VFAARLFRISFSGELAYEIAVPTRYGDALIRALVEAGREFDAVVYGTEALGVMRVEKGHVAGNELNGQSSALNMGLGKMVSKKKDSIGMVLSQREGMTDPNGYRLVGVKPVDPNGKLTAGSHFLDIGAAPVIENDGGWLTSKVYSPHLGCDIALGLPEGRRPEDRPQDAGGEPSGETADRDRGRDRKPPLLRPGRRTSPWLIPCTP
jgi:glycine cleavage system aminomethyltransferase T